TSRWQSRASRVSLKKAIELPSTLTERACSSAMAIPPRQMKAGRRRGRFIDRLSEKNSKEKNPSGARAGAERNSSAGEDLQEQEGRQPQAGQREASARDERVPPE